MHAAVEDVHHGRGKQVRVHAAQVFVQRQIGGFRGGARHGERCAQDRVRAHGALVVRAVELEHLGVEGALVVGVHADDGLGDFVVHVIDGGLDALAQVTAFVAIAQLDGFESPGRSAGRNDRAGEGAVVQRDLNFDGRVAAGIKNLATVDIENDAHRMKPPCSDYHDRKILSGC